MKESRQSIRGMSATYGIALLTATPTLECDCSNIIVQIISIALLFLISPSNGQGIYIFASAIYFNKFTSPHTAMPFFRLSYLSHMPSRNFSYHHLPHEFYKHCWRCDRFHLCCLRCSCTQHYLECDEPVWVHKRCSKHEHYLNSDKYDHLK